MTEVDDCTGFGDRRQSESQRGGGLRQSIIQSDHAMVRGQVEGRIMSRLQWIASSLVLIAALTA
ncbi:MAG: hypothetical protein WBR18_06205, partial [Anaerolineales bacterium]